MIETAERQLGKPIDEAKKLYRAYLAEPYDGIGQYVLVSLSRTSVAAGFKARIAAGDFGTGRTFPIGTPVLIRSDRGEFEVFLGSRPNIVCIDNVTLGGCHFSIDDDLTVAATLKPVAFSRTGNSDPGNSVVGPKGGYIDYIVHNGHYDGLLVLARGTLHFYLSFSFNGNFLQASPPTARWQLLRNGALVAEYTEVASGGCFAGICGWTPLRHVEADIDVEIGDRITGQLSWPNVGTFALPAGVGDTSERLVATGSICIPQRLLPGPIGPPGTGVGPIPPISPVFPKTLIVEGIPSAEAFGIPTIHWGYQPVSILSEEAFGTVTVISGGVKILPTGIPSAEVFGLINKPSLSFTGQLGVPEAQPGNIELGAP